jgi:hypothetical protein
LSSQYVLAFFFMATGGFKTYKADVHGNANTALEGAADVVAVPGDTLGYVGVDAGSDEEAGKVLGAVAFNAGQDSEADNANAWSVTGQRKKKRAGTGTHATMQKPIM